MSKRFFAILVAVILGLGAIFWFTKSDSGTSSSSTNVQATNHIKGEGKKGVTLVEYGDYQCSVCEGYFSTVKQVVDQFSQDIYFQFRNLPLSQIHPNAFAAARAAEAASKQNKFWEMHDMLYDQAIWQSWTSSSSPQALFESYASLLGLNVDQFRQDFSSSEVNSIINADLDAFKKTGQQLSTPAFFLDGTYVDNGKLSDSNIPSAAKFTELIKAAIKAKNQ
jgi:protein-disulfide isomerase